MRRRNEVLVGLFTAVALVLVVVGTIWLSRGGLRRGYPLYAKVPWGNNLKQGQPVWFAGVQVGYVDDAQLLQTEGAVVITLRIEDKYKIPRGTTAAVVPNGLFGDVAVALTPLRPNHVSFAAGDTVPFKPAGASMAALLARVDSMSTSIKLMLDALNSELVAGGGIADLRRTMASANKLVGDLSATVNEQSRQLSATLATFRGSAERASSAIDTAQLHGIQRNLNTTTANVAALTDSLRMTASRVNALIARAETGDGSAAKFLNDPALFNDTHRLLVRLDSLMVDLRANPKKYINLSIF